MKGSREILISFLISAFSLYALHEYQEGAAREKKRNPSPGSATLMSGVTEDPALSLNWGLQKLEIQKAWRESQGQPDIVVAIIDTGVDTSHPDLKRSLWRNAGETGLDENGMSKATNGRDDDDNGFVDDVHGWNFVSNSPEIMDDHGHGTHVAGIIGGSTGVAPGVSLMILKYYDSEETGAENLEHSLRAIRYAIRMGATIINYSGGGRLRSYDEEEMLKWAHQADILVVAAAGNEGVNSDFFHFYPADYDLPNILSVTATDRENRLFNGSNFGAFTVDIGAPGKNIYSTLPNGRHGYMSGTSQATAFASGVAALVLSSEPAKLKPEQLISRILATGTPSLFMKNKSRSGGIVNAASALKGSDQKIAQTRKTRSFASPEAESF